MLQAQEINNFKALSALYWPKDKISTNKKLQHKLRFHIPLGGLSMDMKKSGHREWCCGGCPALSATFLSGELYLPL